MMTVWIPKSCLGARMMQRIEKQRTKARRRVQRVLAHERRSLTSGYLVSLIRTRGSRKGTQGCTRGFSSYIDPALRNRIWLYLWAFMPRDEPDAAIELMV